MSPDDIFSVRPPLDLAALVKQHAGKNYELHSAHINPANVRMLKTIGFDRCNTRAEGPYLWDVLMGIGKMALTQRAEKFSC